MVWYLLQLPSFSRDSFTLSAPQTAILSLSWGRWQLKQGYDILTELRFSCMIYDQLLPWNYSWQKQNYTIMHLISCCKFDMDICLGKNRASRSGQECAYKALHSGQGLPFRFYSLAKNALVHNNSIKAACPAFLSVYTVSAYVYTLDLGSSIAL